MSSLSRDWVWMAVPVEGGVPHTPLHPPSIRPRRRLHFAILSTFSMQWRFFLWVAAAQTAVRVHQSIVPADASLYLRCVIECTDCWGERGEGVYHRLQSRLQLQLLFDNMCGFISFTCKQWIRGLFDYCAPRFHFLSARWLSASYHSRFRHSSSVDTKKVTSHTHTHRHSHMSTRPRMMTNTCSTQKDSQAA